MERYTELLKGELINALGCTEPIALALAAAKAREVLGAMPAKVNVKCSGNIIKNVKAVTVPNTNGMKGVESAAAIGITGGISTLGLEVLSKVTEEQITLAQKMIDDKVIRVLLKEDVENLDIEIELFDANNNHVEVEIKNKHTNIVKICRNDEVNIQDDCYTDGPVSDLYDGLCLKSIFNYAQTVDISEVQEMLDNQIKCNSAISEEGLTGKWGSAIGKMLLEEDTSLRTRAKAKAAAGSDARMCGCCLPVVINAGSGNQGITCSVPVIEYAKDRKVDKEVLYRALLVSNLIALHIKRYIGRLSAFCGVTSAGVAAGAGIAYIETQSYDIIEKTVGNALMIASGMICDGAKASCAAKIAIAVDAGITGFCMAKYNKNFLPGDGLLKPCIEETIRNIGFVAKEGMKQTDVEVLHMMIQK